MNEPVDVLPVLTRRVRGTLVAMALGLAIVFGLAYWINPYDESGQPRRMETHTQLGLPPCTMKMMLGIPCPSCGMTTSFALLVRGDLKGSVQANFVGTVLAILGLAVIPWAIVSAVASRPLGIVALDRAAIRLIVVLVTLSFIRWAVVLILMWRDRA